MSRIATGNWDAVIVTHSGFEKIPVSRATQEEFIKERVAGDWLSRWNNRRKQGDSRIVKTVGTGEEATGNQTQGTGGGRAKRMTGLTFEELGVDRLFVDEAHYFKNLFYVSKMTRIAGLAARPLRSGPSICSSRCSMSSA